MVTNGYDVIRLLEEHFPLKEAMDWDNSGLMVGDRTRTFKRVYVALDATDEVIEEAVKAKADLLLTHHPLIFRGVKAVTTDSLTGRKILKLAENRIACFSMHTNYDAIDMGRVCAERLKLTAEDGSEARALEITGEDAVTGIGKIGVLERECTLEEFSLQVKEAFHLEGLSLYGDPKKRVKTVAMVPGSGKSEISLALSLGADVLLTGDIGHHEGLDAVEEGLAIVDAGHYGLEHVFVEAAADFLRRECDGLEVLEAELRFPNRFI